MTRRKYNPRISVESKAPNSYAKKYAQKYTDWHWGEQPAMVLDWDDPDLPENMIECGRLVRVHFRAPASVNPRRERDTMIELARPVARRSYVVYDPAHPSERLYLLVSPTATARLAERFFYENSAPEVPLGQLALMVGGRHGKVDDYPNVMVKPIGVMTALVYHTHKKDDGPSYYIHKMGEESAHYPVLAADEQGRLWIAGGNYTCPTPGITD
jgi:hypothetical protein